MFKVFVVEDDAQIADIIVKSISKSGYSCIAAKRLDDIMPEFEEFEPDIVLLDIILPYYDGYYWCGKIRMLSKVPVIFISSKAEDMDIIIASNMGGDDYLVKPFSIEVLMAKMNSMLRRAYSYDNCEMNIISYDQLVLNVGSGMVSANGNSTELTKNETQILSLLLKNRGNTVSRERIIRSLWKEESFIDDNTLTVNMTRIKKKLQTLGLDNYIETKKGLGYMI
ncbi:MAG TPA: response regulator transcription factor [Lachnospiraceae bacterium]|nr:response regulator transcription factor [Lachnospiraceae bacterium]